ncbi:hypothetical protein FHW58_000604 [Duganella sp. 1224]|nr:hypothetical protein [Duganella sp. 1224]
MGNKFKLAALLATCCIGAAHAADFDDATRARVIRDYAQKLEDSYVFPAKGKQLADNLRRHLAQGDYAGLSEKNLADKVQRDLDSVVADQHNGLVYVEFDALDEPPPPPKPAEPVARPGPDNFGFAKFAMRGHTAYLQLTRFAPVDRFSTEALAKIMTQAAGSEAMIIDLRDGHGGVPGMSTLLSSYFFDDRPVHLLDELDRDGKVTDSFITTPAVSGARYGSKRPLYLLVNEDTASASESFAYALQRQQRAIVVGGKTAGGAHKQFGVPVTHHLIAFVAIGRSVDPVSGANWEGTGIQPDLAVPPEQALDVALAEIAKSKGGQ